MKLILLLSFMALASCQLLGTEEEPECEQKCEDKSALCSIDPMPSYCDNALLRPVISKYCGVTCNTCKECSSVQARTICSPDTDPCRDDNPRFCSFFHIGYCSQPLTTFIAQKKCRKHCGLCKPCNPVRVSPRSLCSTSCEDYLPQCEYWAKVSRYCTDPHQKSWMTQQCRHSCGECQKCNGKSPPEQNVLPTATSNVRPTPFKQGTTEKTKTDRFQMVNTARPTPPRQATTERPTVRAPTPALSNGFCQIECNNGSCSGEIQSRYKCECNKTGYKKEFPACRGKCEVRCPKPKGAPDNWATQCEGDSICTCTSTGNRKSGIKPGALCR